MSIGFFCLTTSLTLSSPKWYTLYSARTRKNKVSGSVLLKLTLVDPLNPTANNEQLLKKWKSLSSSFSRPASLEPVNMNENVDSSDYVEDDEEEGDAEYERNYVDNGDHDDVSSKTGSTSDAPDSKISLQSTDSNYSSRRRRPHRIRIRKTPAKQPYSFNRDTDMVGIVFFEVVSITDLPPERNATRTGFDMDPFVVMSFGKRVFRTSTLRHTLNPSYNEKFVFPVLRHEQGYSINLKVIDRDRASNNDFVASANLPVSEILKEAAEPDPDSGLYSFPPVDEYTQQKKSKFTRSRSSTPVQRTSSENSVKINVSTSSSTASSHGDDSTNAIKQSSISTATAIDQDIKPYHIPLNLKNQARWGDSHHCELKINVKYVPYAALRQQFWRCMLKNYEENDSGMISRLGISNMLDALGSTLSEETVDKFFSRFGKSLDEDISVGQAIICLEDQLNKISPPLNAEETGESSPGEVLSPVPTHLDKN